MFRGMLSRAPEKITVTIFKRNQQRSFFMNLCRNFGKLRVNLDSWNSFWCYVLNNHWKCKDTRRIFTVFFKDFPKRTFGEILRCISTKIFNKINEILSS